MTSTMLLGAARHRSTGSRATYREPLFAYAHGQPDTQITDFIETAGRAFKRSRSTSGIRRVCVASGLCIDNWNGCVGVACVLAGIELVGPRRRFALSVPVEDAGLQGYEENDAHCQGALP